MRSIRTVPTLGLLLVLFASCGSEPTEGSEPDREPTITAFSASADRIAPAESVELSWITKDASSVQLFAGSSAIVLGSASAAAGSVEVSPRQTTTFRLEARGRRGAVVSRETTIVVLRHPAPRIESFVASPDLIGAGTEVTLSWRTLETTSVSIADEEGRPVEVAGANPLEGSVSIVPAAATTYVLTASGPGGDVTAQASVTILPNPTASLFADPARIPIGASTTLSWEAPGAVEARVFIEGSEDPIAEGVSGSLVVTPERTSVYLLEASGPGGSAQASHTISVLPVIDVFATDTGGAVRPGTEVELTWAIRGASGASLSNLGGWSYEIPAGQVAEGTTRARVGAGGVFTLIARHGEVESELRSLTLRLTGAPKILRAEIEPEVTAGRGEFATVEFSWEVDGAEGPLQLELIPGGPIPIVSRSNRRDLIELTVNGPAELRLTAQNAAGLDQLTIPLPVAPPPAFSVFRALPSRVGSGESVELSWSVEDAASVVLERDGLALPVDPALVDGSFSETLGVSGAYRLRATNRLGFEVVSEELEVTIGKPIITSFTVSDEVVQPSHPLLLGWKNLGGTSLQVIERDESGVEREVCSEEALAGIDEGSCELAAQAMLGAYTYVLRVSNGDGVEVQELTVHVSESPVVLSLAASPLLLTEGGSVTFSWTAAVGLLGESPTLELRDHHGVVYDLGGADPLSGELTLPIDAPGAYVFTLSAASAGRAPPAARAVSVQVIGLPIVTSFVATPGFAQADADPVTLSWSTESGVSLEIFAVDQEGIAQEQAVCATSTAVASGSCTVRPTKALPDYRMQIRNTLGATLDADLRVGVLPATVISFTADEYDILEGESTFIRWEVERAEQVELGPRFREIAEPFVDAYLYSNGKVAIPVMSGGQELAQAGGRFEFPEGFTFPYFGIVAERAYICANGKLVFNKTNTTSCYEASVDIPPLPSTQDVHLAPLFMPYLRGDFPQRRDSGLWYVLLTDPQTGMRSLVLQFREYVVNRGETRGLFNFEVILHENGEVDYRYGQMEKIDDPPWATGLHSQIGLQSPPPGAGQPGAFGAMISSKSEYPGGLAHRSFRFYPDVIPYGGFVAAVGSKEVTPSNSLSISLFADNVHSHHEEEVRINVHRRVELATVGADPDFPLPNQPFALTWSGSHIARLTIEGGGVVLLDTTDPAQIAAGRFELPSGLAGGEHTLTFRAQGSIGSRDAQIQTLVLPVFPPVDLTAFGADVELLELGGSATLSWEGYGLDGVEILASPGGAIALPPGDPNEGSVVVSPSMTTEYTLIGRSFGRELSLVHTILVRSTSIDSFVTSKGIAFIGESVTLSWTSSGGGTLTFVEDPAQSGTYGGTWMQMQEVDSAFEDISTTGGTLLEDFNSSTAAANIARTLEFPAGFTFPWYGEDRAAIRVLRDGMAGFGLTDVNAVLSARIPLGNPNAAHRNKAFLVFNRAMRSGAGNGTLWWKLDSSGDFLTVQWTGFTANTGTGSMNFQLVLFRDGAFEYRYGEMTHSNANLAEGIGAYLGWQAPSTKLGHQLSWNAAVPGGVRNRSWRVDAERLHFPDSGSATFSPSAAGRLEICKDDGSWRECQSVEIKTVAPGSLMVTEVMTEAAGDPTMRWFEVRNFNAFAVDLRGLTIFAGTRTHVITDPVNPVIIGAMGGYKVFSSKPLTDMGGAASYVYGVGDDLRFNDVDFGLRFETVSLASLAAYSNFNSYAAGRSWELSGQHHGLAAEAAPNDWDETKWCQVMGGTPGATGPTCSPGLGGHYSVDTFSAMPFLDLQTLSGSTSIPLTSSTTEVFPIPGGVPFAFPFFGTTLPANQPIWAATSGITSFAAIDVAFANSQKTFPATWTVTHGFLAPLWYRTNTDLASSAILYNSGTIGGLDVFGIQWNGLSQTGTGSLTYQIQIWETGDLVFAYREVDLTARSGRQEVIGIEAIGGAAGISVSEGWDTRVVPNQSILFKKN